MGAGSRNNSSSLNQAGDEQVADGLSDNSSRIPSGWIFHNNVNKEIALVRSKGIMKHAQGQHTQLNIG